MHIKFRSHFDFWQSNIETNAETSFRVFKIYVRHLRSRHVIKSNKSIIIDFLSHPEPLNEVVLDGQSLIFSSSSLSHLSLIKLNETTHRLSVPSGTLPLTNT